MTYYVSINRNIIAANQRTGADDPPVRWARGRHGKPEYAYEVALGSCVVVYDGNLQLKCGARVVIVTEVEPVKIR